MLLSKPHFQVIEKLFFSLSLNIVRSSKDSMKKLQLIYLKDLCLDKFISLAYLYLLRVMLHLSLKFIRSL